MCGWGVELLFRRLLNLLRNEAAVQVHRVVWLRAAQRKTTSSSAERRAMRIASEDAKALNVLPGMLPKKAGDASASGSGPSAGAPVVPDVFPDVPEAVGEEGPDLSLPDVTARFPNVKVCNQDKPHASKRFTSRLRRCDERVWEAYMRMIK